MKISKESRDLIDTLNLKQDQNALLIGTLEMEFEDNLERVKQEGDDRTRRGALLVEREDRREFFMQAVRRTHAEQKAAGEAALRACEIDPERGEYRIEGDEVRQLVNGRWVSYETAQQFIRPEERQK